MSIFDAYRFEAYGCGSGAFHNRKAYRRVIPRYSVMKSCADVLWLEIFRALAPQLRNAAHKRRHTILSSDINLSPRSASISICTSIYKSSPSLIFSTAWCVRLFIADIQDVAKISMPLSRLTSDETIMSSFAIAAVRFHWVNETKRLSFSVHLCVRKSSNSVF